MVRPISHERYGGHVRYRLSPVLGALREAIQRSQGLSNESLALNLVPWCSLAFTFERGLSRHGRTP
jgi:hypothetical protein